MSASPTNKLESHSEHLTSYLHIIIKLRTKQSKELHPTSHKQKQVTSRSSPQHTGYVNELTHEPQALSSKPEDTHIVTTNKNNASIPQTRQKQGVKKKKKKRKKQKVYTKVVQLKKKWHKQAKKTRKKKNKEKTQKKKK